MRIVFLCSGLESGRDGVGDYTRTLAQACAAAGHQVALASLRDAHAPVPRLASPAAEIRLRDVFSNPTEAKSLAAWLQEFNPGWASVQFTPFGFHPRGLGHARARFLRRLLPNSTRRHVMFHEIWLEPGWRNSLRRHLLGKLQRKVVQSWGGAGFQPTVVHTQARLFASRLNRAQIPAAILPLCSSLAVQPADPGAARRWLEQTLRAAGAIPPDSPTLPTYWIGHFGTLYLDRDWSLPAFVEKAAAAAQRMGRRAAFILIGRPGGPGETAWRDLANAFPNTFIGSLGELPRDAVTQAIQACDAMFTGTPADIIEKSGAVSVNRALALPVLMPRHGSTSLADLPPWPDPGLIAADGSQFDLPASRIPAPPHLHPAHLAQAFLHALATRASAANP